LSSDSFPQKFSVKFADNFTASTEFFRLKAIGASTEGRNKKFSFRWPTAIAFDSNRGTLGWGTADRPIGDIKVYLQSSVIEAELKDSFQEINNIDSAAAIEHTETSTDGAREWVDSFISQ
jgi:hypothetical protein